MIDVLLNRSDPCDDFAGCGREREVICGAEMGEEGFCVVGSCGERGDRGRFSCLRSFKLDW